MAELRFDKDFWPRPGPPSAATPDLGDDRACSICGYNLRAIPYRSPCPECGALNGRTEVTPLPWERRQNVWGYMGTVLTVVTQSEEVSLHTWRVDSMGLPLAQQFRRVGITIAAVSYTAMALAWTLAAMSTTVDNPQDAITIALISLPIQAAGIVLAFNEFTMFRIRRLKDLGLPQAGTRHLRAVTYYLSAGLATTPLQLCALPLSYWAVMHGKHVPETLAVHAILLMLQFLVIVPADAKVLWQLLDVPKSGAYARAFLAVPFQLLSASGYLILVPVVTPILVRRLVVGA